MPQQQPYHCVKHPVVMVRRLRKNSGPPWPAIVVSWPTPVSRLHSHFLIEGTWTACQLDPISELFKDSFNTKALEQYMKVPGMLKASCFREGARKSNFLAWGHDLCMYVCIYILSYLIVVCQLSFPLLFPGDKHSTIKWFGPNKSSSPNLRFFRLCLELEARNCRRVG